jgi:cysteinyl-tRNA synthetase
MAERILGVDFDIHGGGIDLVFPHHENEIAQTEAARGRPLARAWMHNGMVRLDEEKMSKSVGNIQLLGDALDEHGRDAIVMWFVGGHYRSPLSFSPATLTDAGRSVERIRDFVRRLDPDGPRPEGFGDYEERFFAALADDFNTPIARAALFDWVSEGNRRLDAGETVGSEGLGELLRVIGMEHLLETGADEAPEEARILAQEREDARAARDFETADRKRDELAALGWEIRDTAAGPELVRKS